MHNLLSSSSTSTSTSASINDKEKDNTNSAKVLIVAPSRELALQITNELNNVWNHDKKSINIVAIVGGLWLYQVKQMRKLNKFIGKTIIVAAPGRLWEMLSKNHEENKNELLSNILFLKYVLIYVHCPLVLLKL